MSDARTQRLFGMEAEKGRWVLVFLGFVINICLGSVYAYSVFKTPVQKLLNVGAFQGGMPFMVFLASFAVLMFFGGRMLGRLGPSRVGMAGGVLVGIGWVLSGVLVKTSIWTLVLTYGVIAGAGVGLAYGGPIAVATRWFPDRRGLATGLTLAGFGGSPFVTANIARPLIQTYGPLNTFIIMGVAIFVIVIALCALLKFPSLEWKPAGWEAANGKASLGMELTASAMVRTSTFGGLFSAYTIGCFAGLMAIGISSPVGTEIIKLDAATAAALVGVFAIFNGAGRPLFGWLTDRITPKWSSVVSLALILLASLMMLKAAEGTVWLYALSFAVLWLCLGGWLAIGPISTTTFFGAKNQARNYGVVFCGYGIGAILANLVSGQSKDIFGNYNVAFIITAVLAAAGIVLSAVLVRPPKAK